MNTLKGIYLTVLRLAGQFIRLPRTIAKTFTSRRQRGVRNALEAERLDRIRNPSKYHLR